MSERTGREASGGTSRAVTYRVGRAHAGSRLDVFLKGMIPRLSRSRIQRAIDERVDLSWNAPVKASTPVVEDGVVTVRGPDLRERERSFDPEVLHEDDDLLAIDKPPDIVVHPTHGHFENTVITKLRKSRGEPELTLAHRLDAETSGVLLLARHRRAARRVQLAFERRRVAKHYLAVVSPAPDQDRFVVDVPLGRTSEDQFVFRQGADGVDAKPSRTEFEVVRHGTSRALVSARPITGRRHQIRAHLAHAGFPIVGDKLYGLPNHVYRKMLLSGGLDPEWAARSGAARTLLHSHRLEVGELRVEAPLPRDMRLVLDAEAELSGGLADS